MIFTSKNAATFFKFKKEMKGILIFSVGTETKKILQKKGFENIINVDGDLQKLLIVIKKYLNKTKKVYHLTSKTQNVELKKFFQDFDCEYYAIKCYTSKMINVEKKLISFMKEKKIILYHSTLLYLRNPLLNRLSRMISKHYAKIKILLLSVKK